MPQKRKNHNKNYAFLSLPQNPKMRLELQVGLLEHKNNKKINLEYTIKRLNMTPSKVGKNPL